MKGESIPRYYNNSFEQMSEIKKIIQNKTFREEAFHNNEEKMNKFFRGINLMDIDETLFKIMRILIKFFRFPILPLFQPIYTKIQKNKVVYLAQSQQDLTRTASFVKAIIKNRSIPSLQFYFKAGCDQNMPEELSKEDQNPKLMNFVMEIDQEINNTSQTSYEEQKKHLDQIEQRLNERIKSTRLVVEKMCLQHYSNILILRQSQLVKSQEQKKMEMKPQLRQKSGRIKVQLNKKNSLQ